MDRDADNDASSALQSLLSRDIRALGALLGNVSRWQHGEAALQLVEDIRAQARQRRANALQPGASQALAQHIAALALDAKRILIKAFANYFQLINIAEDQRSMYRAWLFFTTLIENVQLDLAKADMGIAELYASLVTDVCNALLSAATPMWTR